MIREIEVYRMSGAGNLFSVIDNRRYSFKYEQLKSLSVLLCNQNDFNDLITEGFLAITNSSELDFSVEFFNPDGSTGMMCGNGGRCAVDFALSKIVTNKDKSSYLFSMAGNTYEGRLAPEGISLKFQPPKSIISPKNIEIDGVILTGTYIDVSSDHFVISADEVSKIEVDFNATSIRKFAKKIRSHTDFGDRGANANFYRIESESVTLYTFERGVEDITGACGTGAISTAIHCYLREGLKLPIVIYPPSKLPLVIDFEFDDDKNITAISLTGHTEIISKDIKYLDI